MFITKRPENLEKEDVSIGFFIRAFEGWLCLQGYEFTMNASFMQPFTRQELYMHESQKE